MNRGSFLKNLTAGFGALIFAPKIMAEIQPEKIVSSYDAYKAKPLNTIPYDWISFTGSYQSTGSPISGVSYFPEMKYDY